MGHLDQTKTSIPRMLGFGPSRAIEDALSAWIGPRVRYHSVVGRAWNGRSAADRLVVDSQEIQTLRGQLGLSRAELARFLAVSEATVVRWESDRRASEPRGLQAILLTALADAVCNDGADAVSRLVRSSGGNHRHALRELLVAAG